MLIGTEEFASEVVDIIHGDKPISKVAEKYGMSAHEVFELVFLFKISGKSTVKRLVLSKLKLLSLLSVIQMIFERILPKNCKSRFSNWLSIRFPGLIFYQEFSSKASVLDGFVDSIYEVIQGNESTENVCKIFHVSEEYIEHLLSEYINAGISSLKNHIISFESIIGKSIDSIKRPQRILRKIFVTSIFISLFFGLFSIIVLSINKYIDSSDNILQTDISKRAGTISEREPLSLSYKKMDGIFVSDSFETYETELGSSYFAIKAYLDNEKYTELLALIDNLKFKYPRNVLLYYLEARCHKELLGPVFDWSSYELIQPDSLGTKICSSGFSFSHHLDESIKMYRYVYDNFGDTTLADDALGMLAGINYRIGKFKLAAQLYLKLLDQYKETDQYITYDLKAAVYAFLMRNRGFPKNSINNMYKSVARLRGYFKTPKEIISMSIESLTDEELFMIRKYCAITKDYYVLAYFGYINELFDNYKNYEIKTQLLEKIYIGLLEDNRRVEAEKIANTIGVRLQRINDIDKLIQLTRNNQFEDAYLKSNEWLEKYSDTHDIMALRVSEIKATCAYKMSDIESLLNDLNNIIKTSYYLESGYKYDNSVNRYLLSELESKEYVIKNLAPLVTELLVRNNEWHFIVNIPEHFDPILKRKIYEIYFISLMLNHNFQDAKGVCKQFLRVCSAAEIECPEQFGILLSCEEIRTYLEMLDILIIQSASEVLTNQRIKKKLEDLRNDISDVLRSYYEYSMLKKNDILVVLAILNETLELAEKKIFTENIVTLYDLLRDKDLSESLIAETRSLHEKYANKYLLKFFKYEEVFELSVVSDHYIFDLFEGVHLWETNDIPYGYFFKDLILLNAYLMLRNYGDEMSVRGYLLYHFDPERFLKKLPFQSEQLNHLIVLQEEMLKKSFDNKSHRSNYPPYQIYRKKIRLCINSIFSLKQ